MQENQIKLSAHEADMASKQTKVLCVDDEIFNLDILKKHLVKSGYDAILATDGDEAIDILENSHDSIDIVLLDRMMPHMDGLEVLKKIKSDERLQNIPVIIQTAMVAPKEIIEGIEAGAYYYITKPYEANVLLSIVDAATREYREKNNLQTRIDKSDAVFRNAISGEYEFKTLASGRELAGFLANFSNVPYKTIIALTALVTNAIEHGNLEIGYELKNELLLAGKYQEEFERRSKVPEYANRKVNVSFKREGKDIKIYIKDQGSGFNWEGYIGFDASRITEPNGRGIAIANSTSPKSIEYIGNGNQVCYTIYG